MSDSESTERRLADALAECERLREENRQLRERLQLLQIKPSSTPLSAQVASTAAGTITAKSSPDEKVKLFRSLFRGSEDVYALRWEGRTGKTGYSPACRKVWDTSFCRDSAEPREYFPLLDHVIEDQLTGKVTIGVYPLLTDEKCWLLAAVAIFAPRWLTSCSPHSPCNFAAAIAGRYDGSEFKLDVQH